MRFKEAFSRSSERSRLASSAVMPPYWARQRWKVCSETSSALGHFGYLGALGQHPLGLAELADDLRGSVSPVLHLIGPPLAHVASE